MKVRMVDESTSGARVEGVEIEIAEPMMTVRDLIKARLLREIDQRNERTRLVVPDSKGLKVDVDKQMKVACRAFENQSLLILAPSGQVDSLDERLTLTDGDEVSFLRLTPLIGG